MEPGVVVVSYLIVIDVLWSSATVAVEQPNNTATVPSIAIFLKLHLLKQKAPFLRVPLFVLKIIAGFLIKSYFFKISDIILDMVDVSDYTASSTIGLPSFRKNNANSFAWTGKGTRSSNAIDPTPEDNLVKRFVAIRGGKAFYSSNLVTWEQADYPSNDWDEMVYGGNKFVAVNASSNSAAYSLDGSSWNTTFIGNNPAGFFEIAYGNGKFVATGSYYWNAQVASSTDGLSWTTGQGYTFSMWYYPRISYGNGKFIVLTPFESYVSTDGVTWTYSVLPSFMQYKSFNVAFGNGVFAAVETGSSGSQTAVYSADGVTWTQASGLPSTFGWNGIAYGNGKFVAVSSNGKTAYSTDGSVWTEGNNVPAAFPSIYGFTSLVYGDGKFVAAVMNGMNGGSENHLIYSTDGISWTGVNLPTSDIGTYSATASIAYGEWPQAVI